MRNNIYLSQAMMYLSDFISNLLATGKVYVQTQLIIPTEDDRAQTALLLKNWYEQDRLEMPGDAPAFSGVSALWAAEYFFLAVQLTVIRDIAEEELPRLIVPYAAAQTPEAIYSADLILRCLPALFDLAKGLAPGDKLVSELENLATAWPFSSIGIPIKKEVDIDVIFSNPSLKQEYIDRIIQQKNAARITDQTIEDAVRETIGEQSLLVWPELEWQFINKDGTK